MKACPTPAGGKPECEQAYYGNGQSVTVLCVIKGETYTHPDGAYTTNTYVRRSQGDYLVKWLVSVPGGQEAMPPGTAPVWEC